jgi:hypothetical protein
MVDVMMLSEKNYWGTKMGEALMFRHKTTTLPASLKFTVQSVTWTNPVHEEEPLVKFSLERVVKNYLPFVIPEVSLLCSQDQSHFGPSSASWNKLQPHKPQFNIILLSTVAVSIIGLNKIILRLAGLVRAGIVISTIYSYT